MILPDHPTPISKRTHTADPVPFAMAGKDIIADDVTVLNEKTAKAGSMYVKDGSKLMKMLITGDLGRG